MENVISLVFVNSDHCPQTNDHVLNFASLSVSACFSHFFRSIYHFTTASFESTVGSAGFSISVSRSSVNIFLKSNGFGRVLLSMCIIASVVLLNWWVFRPGSPLNW